MGGESKQTTTQNSTTNPWEAATPALKGILGQVQGNLSNTGITNAENTALANIQANGQNTSAFTPQVNQFVTSLLGGGGATDQAGNVQANYDRYQGQVNPLASNTNYNPWDTSGFKDAIGTQISDITNATNGSFAAAGRDFSGANSQALGRGIMQGVSPTIAAQYNQNVNNQQGAADRLYAGGNTNAGLLSGMQQQKIANQGAGMQAAGQASEIANAGANATLQAEAARRGIPVQALGLLAQIGVPIGGLGGQSTGQSNGTQQMSGVDQFAKITGGFKNLFPFGL